MNGAFSSSVTGSAQARLMLAALKVENRMRLSPGRQHLPRLKRKMTMTGWR